MTLWPLALVGAGVAVVAVAAGGRKLTVPGGKVRPYLPPPPAPAPYEAPPGEPVPALTAQEFLAMLEHRMFMLRNWSPVTATHPAAMSYALALRRLPRESGAQPDASWLPFPVPQAELYEFFEGAAATTDKIQGRLVNDPTNANHPADLAWKAGQSAAVAYGALLDEEFGPGTAQREQLFENYGQAWLLAPGDLPFWFYTALTVLPSLKSGDPLGNVLRRVVGVAG